MSHTDYRTTTVLCLIYISLTHENKSPISNPIFLHHNVASLVSLFNFCYFSSEHDINYFEWFTRTENKRDCLILLNERIFFSFIIVGRNGILLPKLFWTTVRKNCSSDREKLLKFEAEGREFTKLLRSLEQFIQTVKGQNNFW